MTEQEQTDYQTFLNAARENFIKDQGLQGKVDQMKASGKFNVDFLDLMAMFYAQNNPDQLKNPELAKGKDVVVGPAEIRDILHEDDNNIVKLWNENITNKGKFWSVEYGWVGADPINPIYQKISIFGVDTEIQYSDEGISGVLVGISSIDNNPNDKVLWVIVKDNSNDLHLVPRFISLDSNFTIPNGAICRDNTTAFYTLPEDVLFGPLTDPDHGKTITLDQLYANLGKPVDTDTNSYLFNQWIANHGEQKLTPGFSPCYLNGLPYTSHVRIDPYFSPPIWDELVPAK
jgi:hypothetical protein